MYVYALLSVMMHYLCQTKKGLFIYFSLLCKKKKYEIIFSITFWQNSLFDIPSSAIFMISGRAPNEIIYFQRFNINMT